MSAGAAVSVVAWMVTPTAVVAAAIHAPRLARAVHHLVVPHRHSATRSGPDPAAAPVPIEELARRLRRLLAEHDALSHNPWAASRVRHLAALEEAIGDCALEAATALDVARPQLRALGTVTHDDLGKLLRALAAAGFVLPARSELLLAGLHG